MGLTNEEAEMSGMKQFTRLTGAIANVENLIHLKRLGKIRLGIKKISTKTKKEYPSETDHFVVTKQVEDYYGPNPKVLDGAMFSSNNPEDVYEEKLALYGASSGLKCQGDGKAAQRRDEKGAWIDRTCPCEFLKTPENPGGQCGPQAHLKVMLPKIPGGMWGYWQITTRSIYARAGILSSLADLQAKVGRLAYVPLKLERIAQEIVHDGKKKVHYIVGFTPMLDLPQIMELRSKPELLMLPVHYEMEPALDENPRLDPVDVETDEEPDEDDSEGIDAEKLADMTNQELDAVQKALKEQQEKRAVTTSTHQTVVPETKPLPQQTPGSSASTQSGQAAAGGTPVKSAAPAEKKAEPVLISPEDWREIIFAIDEVPELVMLKKRWKAENNVDNITALREAGQKALMTYLRIEAKNIGIPVPF